MQNMLSQKPAKMTRTLVEKKLLIFEPNLQQVILAAIYVRFHLWFAYCCHTYLYSNVEEKVH